MTVAYLSAQVLFILDAALDIVGSQQQKKKDILIFFSASTSISAAGFFLLHAYPGTLSMLTMTTFGIINYRFNKRGKKVSIPIILVFMMAVTGFELVAFEVITDIFPVIGACCYILAMAQSRECNVRLFAASRLLSFMIYDLAAAAYVAFLTDGISVLLIIVAILKHDIMPYFKNQPL